MNQQRRSFFLATFAALLFSSCSTMTPERIQTLVEMAAVAAQFGLQTWIATHPPEQRLAFEHVVVALETVDLGSPVMTEEEKMALFVTRLESLPTSRLAARQAEIYWSGQPKNVPEDRFLTSMVIWDARSQRAIKVEGKARVPVMKATLRGLKRGLAPMPPQMPSKARRVANTNWFDPRWLADGSKPAQMLPGDRVSPWTTNAYYDPPLMPKGSRSKTATAETQPLSDAELDKQFEEVKAKLAKPADYVVERQDGTNWHPAVLITNAPVGEWRIRQVK